MVKLRGGERIVAGHEMILGKFDMLMNYPNLVRCRSGQHLEGDHEHQSQGRDQHPN
jgi:hypothetical protein